MPTQELIRGFPPFFQEQLDRKTPEDRKVYLAGMARIERKRQRKHEYDRACLLHDEGHDIGPYVSAYDDLWWLHDKKQAASSSDLALLGLDVEVTLCKRIVKNAYRRQARKLHPDTGGDEEQFKALHAAYRTILANTKA